MCVRKSKWVIGSRLARVRRWRKTLAQQSQNIPIAHDGLGITHDTSTIAYEALYHHSSYYATESPTARLWFLCERFLKTFLTLIVWLLVPVLVRHDGILDERQYIQWIDHKNQWEQYMIDVEVLVCLFVYINNEWGVGGPAWFAYFEDFYSIKTTLNFVPQTPNPFFCRDYLPFVSS